MAGEHSNRSKSLPRAAGISKPTPRDRSERTIVRQRQALSKSEAQDIVRTILAGEESTYALVSCQDYQRSHGKFRSSAYTQYQFLCYTRTTTCVGWLVCSYAINSACPLTTALRVFNTAQGTSTLVKHSEAHDKEKEKAFEGKLQLSLADEKKVCDAAVYAVAFGHLPLSFTERKPDMVRFSRALVEAGQTVPMGKAIDVEHLLPSSKAVTAAVQQLAQKKRHDFKLNALQDALWSGGGVTSDGLKEKNQGRKYYDFVAHYFKFGKPNPITGIAPVSLKSRVLFIEEHKGPESAAALRASYDK